MNENIFHNSKLQNQLLKVKIYFLQFTNMKLLPTANNRGATPILMYVIGNIFSQIDSLREAWCVNMFCSYMVNFNEEYVKDRCYVLDKNTGKENDRQSKAK